MHANGDDQRVRTNRTDGARLRQRLSFTDVVEGMYAASKRISQFVTPALSLNGAREPAPKNNQKMAKIAGKRRRTDGICPRALSSIYGESAKVQKLPPLRTKFSQILRNLAFFLVMIENLLHPAISGGAIRSVFRIIPHCGRKRTADTGGSIRSIVLLINPEILQDTVYDSLRHRFLEILAVDLFILGGVADMT